MERLTSCQEENGEEKLKFEEEKLAPDHPFLIEEIINDFDAVTHLRLRPFRHRNDGSADLARLNIVQGRNPVGPAFFELLFVACHAHPPTPGQLPQQFSSQQPRINSHLRTDSLAHSFPPAGSNSTTY